MCHRRNRANSFFSVQSARMIRMIAWLGCILLDTSCLTAKDDSSAPVVSASAVGREKPSPRAQENQGCDVIGVIGQNRARTIFATENGIVERLNVTVGGEIQLNGNLVDLECHDNLLLRTTKQLELRRLQVKRQVIKSKRRTLTRNLSLDLRASATIPQRERQASVDELHELSLESKDNSIAIRLVKSELERSNEKVRSCSIKSVYSGLVEKIHVRETMSVRTGDPLIDILVHEPDRIRYFVSVDSMAGIEVGDEVSFGSLGNRDEHHQYQCRARISWVSRAVHSVTGLVEVWADVMPCDDLESYLSGGEVMVRLKACDQFEKGLSRSIDRAMKVSSNAGYNKKNEK